MTTTIGSLDLGALSDLREDVTQYFWFESSSSSAWGSGAHVTLYPESQFTDPNNANYMKGQNILMNTDGFSIRNGALPMMVLDNDSLDFNVIDTTNNTYTNVASFGANGASIGNINQYSNIEITSSGIIINSNDFDHIVRPATIGGGSIAIGYDAAINATYSASFNRSSVEQTGTYGFSSGLQTRVKGMGGNASGYNPNIDSVANNYFITAQGYGSHAEGFINNDTNITSDNNSNGFSGGTIIAYGHGSHAEGFVQGASIYTYGSNTQRGANIVAEGHGSHAEGFVNDSENQGVSNRIRAEGNGSHAEGYCQSGQIIAEGDGAHAEGYVDSSSSGIFAYGNGSHAEGIGTVARGNASHAEGRNTNATGNASHAGGIGTVATTAGSMSFGTYNDVTSGIYLLTIGNGTDNNNRSNLFSIASDSTVAFANPSKTFVVTTETFSYSAISNGSSSGAKSVTFSAQGYYPIGIMGLRTGNSSAVPTRFNLKSRASGSVTFTYVLRAVGGNVPAGSGGVDILWIKIT